MKKVLTAIIALFVCVVSYAASPYLQDITLTSSDGTTLDFYANRSNMVVFKTAGTNFSHVGTFYVGSTISNQSGYVEARFSVELSMSYGLKEMKGTIYYSSSNGHVYNVTLDGSMYKSSQRTVVSRRR